MRARTMTALLLALLIGTCSTAMAADDAGGSDSQALRQQITRAMPEPDAVLASYSTDVERYAALYILTDRLAYRGDGSAAALEKRQAYRRAMDRVSPPSSTDAKFISARTKLQESSQFRFDVISRFLPMLAGEAGVQVQKDEYKSAEAQGMRNFWAGIGTCIGATLALPLLLLALFQRQWIRPRAPNRDHAFQLPSALAHIRLPWQSYFVTFDCGVISSRQSYLSTWTETHIESGNPDALDSRDRATKYHRVDRQQQRFTFTLRTTDERTRQFDFPSYGLDLAEGDIISVIDRRGRPLLAHNHTRGKTESLLEEASRNHGFSGAFLWLLGAAFGYFAFLQMDHFISPQVPLAHTTLGAWMAITAVALALWIGVVKLVLVRIRNGKFHRKWEPKLEAFMKDKTPALMQHYGGSGKDWLQETGR